MTATDELRRMLDERGVEWDYGPSGSFSTAFRVNGLELSFVDWRHGLLCSTILTPAQAIEATLGRGECHVDVLNTGDCAGYECSEYIMHCNGCGHEFGHVLYNEDGDVWMSETPNFCPNCGRRVDA